jgi:hypothetical protein
VNAAGFPTDWDAWHTEWSAWLAAHPQLTPVPKQIPGRNFLADEILGTFRLPSGRTAELSEVTFPNLVDRDSATGRLLDERRRLVGVTFTDRSNLVVDSFAELETALALR